MTAKLNGYVWEMYKASFEGQLALSYFERLDNFAERADLFELFMGVGDWIYAHASDDLEWTEVALGLAENRYVTAVRDAAQKLAADTPEEIQQLLTHMVSSGTVALSDEDGDVLTLDDVFGNLHLLSLGLHLAHPDIFLPYALDGNFHLALKISDAFSIPLPTVPPKNDRLARWLYYGQFCAAFQEFRKLNEMTLPELLAFMYDFSVNYVDSGENDDLPEPRNAWLLIGGVESGGPDWLNQAQETARSSWQGNLDMRRGDVCIMYVRSPVSAVHSLWRVVEDAYEDPFFH